MQSEDLAKSAIQVNCVPSTSGISRRKSVEKPKQKPSNIVIDKPQNKTRRRQRKKSAKDEVDNPTNIGRLPRSFNERVPPISSVLVKKPPESPIPVVNSNKKEIELTYTIRQILSQTNGRFIKKRNTKSKRVKLNSFIEDSNTCVFTTNLVNHLVLLSENFAFYDNHTVRRKNRKYYNSFPSIEPDSDSHSVEDVAETIDLGNISLTSVLNAESNSLPISPSKKIKKRDRRKAKNKDKPKKVAEINNDTSLTEKSNKQKKEKSKFGVYITKEAALIGIQNGELFSGTLRINPRNVNQSYVNNKDRSKEDYVLESVEDRNGALDGDEVVLELKNVDNSHGRIPGRVVLIEKQVHPRVVVGNLAIPGEKLKNRSDAILFPKDKRLPLMRIPPTDWPKGFEKNPEKFKKNIFVAKILEYKLPKYARGNLIEDLGQEGDLNVEEKAILREFDLDVTPFVDADIAHLNFSKIIDPKEFAYREDIRKQCVFTIDPPTARDLDDAVSVKVLNNGNYEIGVHISDVTYYLAEGNVLDEKVSRKATTIYMVRNVYHMLPVELCLHCSLLPGTDKLAFSVFWEMNDHGEIINKRFTRTVINSCVQLAYDHAQIMLEEPEKEFTDDELPVIHNGFTYKDLSKTVNILWKIASILRRKRKENGALKIDQVKLSFDLDPITGLPNGFKVYENKEAHRLIEEFMLLANISTAEKILEVFPDLAFLRCHDPPKMTMLKELQSNLETYGIFLDISSSKSIASSVAGYVGDENFSAECRSSVLYHLLAKPMVRAQYFCASTTVESNFRHFALSVPIYTHFTSPIRRYADIMVHRLLAAALDYIEKPQWSVQHVTKIATNCNTKKYNAKRAGDSSSELYLAHFVEKNQPFVEDAVVVEVRENSFDVLVLKTGSVIRIYNDKLGQGVKSTSELIKAGVDAQKPLFKTILSFEKTPEYEASKLVIEMFSHIKVNLKKKTKGYKLEASLMRPVN